MEIKVAKSIILNVNVKIKYTLANWPLKIAVLKYDTVME